MVSVDSRHSSIPREYAVLIGEICVAWNYLEDFVGFLMSFYLGFDGDLAGAILASLGNQSRIDLLMHLAKNDGKRMALLRSIEYFSTAFSICRENRNIIVHSAVRMGSAMDIIGLEKASKSKLGQKVYYAYDLSEIERVRNDLALLTDFATRLLITVALPFAYRGAVLEGAKLDPELGQPRPLPDIPPLPRKLTPLPPAVRPGVPPPPESSQL